MFQKRASLSLSVNAIVILILAIVMLGLGMAFIRGMFGQVQDTFEQKIKEEPEPLTPSIRNPITLSREHLITHSSEVEVIKVAIFNPTNASWGGAEPNLTCPSGPTVTDDANPKTLKAGDFDIFTMKIESSGVQDTYLCEVNIVTTSGDAGDYTEDIAIELRN